MTKILVLDNEGSIYDEPFRAHGQLIYTQEYLEDCDLVVFTGGTDVSPELYGDSPHPTTSTPDTERDKLEQKIFNEAYIMAIPMVGICRGAQFLNVMNDGYLIQNVNGHGIAGCHSMQTHDGRNIQVTSTHHQMMVPAPDAHLLGWSENVATVFEAGGIISPTGIMQPLRDHQGVYKEPEAVFWPRTNSLGVQYHPEYMSKDSDGWLYFQELLETFIFRV